MGIVNLIPWCTPKSVLRLRVETVQDNQRTVTIREFPAMIGRRFDSQLQLEDRFVSHIHCLVSIVQGRFYLQDLESRNGTRLNGAEVKIVALHPGDKIDVGATRLTVESISVAKQEELELAR